jgi:putative membrane protein
VFLLKPLIISALSLWLVSLFLPGLNFTTWWALIAATIVLSLVQNFIRPILQLFFLPITVVTLGFFASFLNLALLWLVTALVPGFHIDPMTLLGYSLNQWLSLVAVSFAISLVQMLIKRLW